LGVSYQVFARKYRPRTFDDVLGQDHVVRTLRNAIAQNRLAHAYLFVGPRGTGKTSTARIFAKALNCSNGPRVDFDPDEEICQEIEKGICLDVREIDGASNNGVDQVRDLREEVKFAPARCRFKIYYIDEVHMLSTAAFNALLKTLEEPPEHVKFIFATTEAHKILPTIISRCQRFDLRRIPANVIAKHLLHIASLEKIQVDQKAAYAIAKGAEGGMRDAQSMLDQLVAFCGEQITEEDVLNIFGFTRGETIATLAQRVLDRDTVGALKELHAQGEGGKDLSRLLADLIQHFRTILVHQVDAAAAEEDLAPEVAAMVRAQAAQCPAESLLRVMDGLAEIDARMRWAGNKLLHFEIGLIQAVQTLGEVTLTEVMQALRSDSGGSSTPSGPVARQPVVAPSPVVQKPPAPPARAQAVAPQPVIAQPVTPPPAATVPALEPPASIDPEPAVVAETPPVAAGGDFWTVFLARVHVERQLVSHWLEDGGALLAMEEKRFKIGLPESETGPRSMIMTGVNKSTLERIASELMGRPLTMEIVLDPNLKVPEHAPTPPPASAPAPAAAPAKAAESAPTAKPAAPEDKDLHEPLILAAMEKFKASLVTP
jgi:DNA polymerase-3 subunit gamma/tau